MTREIITVQIGNVSNFVGTHWWNLQESSFIFDRQKADADETRLNHDVLFREVTYCPRVIVIDDNEKVGQTTALRCLYTDQTNDKTVAQQTWAGNTLVHNMASTSNEFVTDLEEEAASSQANLKKVRVEDKFYQLDNCVETWTDFLRVPLHPKSILTLPNVLCEDKLTRFDVGQTLAKETNVNEFIENKFRFFSEECDALQGFQLLFDVDNSFSGIASVVAEYIRDEFRSSSIVSYPINADYLMLKEHYEWSLFLSNVAQSLVDITSRSNLTTPLSLIKRWRRGNIEFRKFDHLRYQPNLPYHTSGIIAASLETASSSWRLMSGPDKLEDVCNFLTDGRRKLGHLHVDIPFGLEELAKNNFHSRSVTPGANELQETSNPLSQPGKFTLNVRGTKNLIVPDKSSVPLDKSGYVSEILYDYFSKNSSSQFSMCSTHEPIYTKSPFPHIFADYVSKYGVLSQTKRTTKEGVESVSVLCKLESSASSSFQFVNDLCREVSKLDIKKLNIDLDNFEGVKEGLNSIKDNLM